MEVEVAKIACNACGARVHMCPSGKYYAAVSDPTNALGEEPGYIHLILGEQQSIWFNSHFNTPIGNGTAVWVSARKTPVIESREGFALEAYHHLGLFCAKAGLKIGPLRSHSDMLATVDVEVGEGTCLHLFINIGSQKIEVRWYEDRRARMMSVRGGFVEACAIVTALDKLKPYADYIEHLPTFMNRRKA